MRKILLNRGSGLPGNVLLKHNLEGARASANDTSAEDGMHVSHRFPRASVASDVDRLGQSVDAAVDVGSLLPRRESNETLLKRRAG